MSKQGVLLVNLGSPDSTEIPDVRKYLNEFLMDGRVIDYPWLLRRFVVNMVLRKRPAASAEAYESIWTEEGSPLVVTSRKATKHLEKQIDLPLELAMRYQNPSIGSALEKLAKQGVDDLLLIPLFPHYAMSSFETAVERVKELISKKHKGMSLKVQPPYYNHEGYIEALTDSMRPYLEEPFDKLLFSYHSIPKRHVTNYNAQTKSHCLKTEDCCEGCHPVHDICYRAQCLKTTQAVVERLGLKAEQFAVSFQSRLGPEKWLTPTTENELDRFAKEGIKKLMVVCPAFVSDCLETLEEIGIRGKEEFISKGGESLQLIPCMNEHPGWINALASMVEDFKGEQVNKV
ncbi:ferrochelatase [Verrucomicrobia bacterium]|nr:ferrochelatase [Verrucomicrobiota bacterium]